jgi:hypothetical protein
MFIRSDNQGPVRPWEWREWSTTPVRGVCHCPNEEAVLNVHRALRFVCCDPVREREGAVAGPVTISSNSLLCFNPSAVWGHPLTYPRTRKTSIDFCLGPSATRNNQREE